MDINAAVGRDQGLGDEKLLAVAHWRESPAFDARERVALEYAERVTYSDRDVDDEFWKRLQARFSEPEVVELTAIIGFENFSSKFNHTLRISEQQFCPLPVVEHNDEGA